MSEFLAVFLDVILPVFGIIALGFLIGGRLELQARTLTRVAYHVFVPAFIFQAISTSQVPFAGAMKMVLFIVVAHLLVAFVAGVIGKALNRTRETIAAFIMIAIFGNVGNYGLALIQFRLGEEALPSATLYFVAIVIVSFVVCVGAAGWAKGGNKGAVWGVMKTPALWATIPALMVSSVGFTLPLLFSRMIGLLAAAMIPVMLFALGLQLLEQKRISLSKDVVLASGLRLLLAPLLTFMVAIPFGLGSLETTSGILQAGMPAAILVAIIAKENNIVPDFVTSVVVVSTLASLLTLSVLMVIL
ncbi:MAG: AEC family transporter [Geopsychrobacter sp.]|nr:AEC family transporter [Geopsychrobacter sp.]